MWRQKQLGVSWVQQERSVGGDNVNAMLWQNGHAYNLNNLIAPTRLHLNEAFFISARGQIACLGTLPNGDHRVALVTPPTKPLKRSLLQSPTGQPRTATRLPLPRSAATTTSGSRCPSGSSRGSAWLA